MTGALSIDPASLSQKLVIPVRYMAEGEILQTTSTAIGEEVIHVRSARPPRPGLFVGFKLYFERGIWASVRWRQRSVPVAPGRVPQRDALSPQRWLGSPLLVTPGPPGSRGAGVRSGTR